MTEYVKTWERKNWKVALENIDLLRTLYDETKKCTQLTWVTISWSI